MKQNALDNLEVVCKRKYLVRDFYTRYQEEFKLQLLNGAETLDSKITEPYINRPGMALAGFLDVYTHQRVQLIGTTEWSYLESVGKDRRMEIFDRLKKYPSPLWVVTHDLPAHNELVEMCTELKIPIMSCQKPSITLIRSLQKILENWFAPYVNVHASLVDVYGVGMLYVGQSNIGKSECALDLVERGHRLVADDAVRLTRIGDSIIGKSSNIIDHHMEIRGVGIIDIKSMFGIHAVRKVKKVEIIVDLQLWNAETSYERTGLGDATRQIMGIPVNTVQIPITPGKNMTVISEVIAMNMLMKMNGIDSAAEFNNKLIDIIAAKKSNAYNEMAMDHENSTDFYE
ncbi:MAG: HPr(Ser) kinase/phosphatase [Fibrobacterales bacterium]